MFERVAQGRCEVGDEDERAEPHGSVEVGDEGLRLEVRHELLRQEIDERADAGHKDTGPPPDQPRDERDGQQVEENEGIVGAGQVVDQTLQDDQQEAEREQE